MNTGPGKLAALTPPRYGRSAVNLSRITLVGVYYLGVLALIVAGAILWSTGHGTGDPYLSLGIALALAPVAVIWFRRRSGRD
jgi:hypothetical protein